MITAPSLVPLIVIDTTCSVPSTDLTLKLSSTFSPTFRLSNALLAVKVHAPASVIDRLPFVPIKVSARKPAALSTSVAVSVPVICTGALVSAALPLATPVITAPSLVPLIVTLTVVAVPSADLTVKVSEADWPTLRPLNASLAT